MQEKDSASKLRSARDEMEQRVKERTCELSHANLDLTREIKGRGNVQNANCELSQRYSTIQDDERRRIARDLHDGVGQILTAALMAASQARLSQNRCQPPSIRDCEKWKIFCSMPFAMCARCPTVTPATFGRERPIFGDPLVWGGILESQQYKADSRARRADGAVRPRG